MKNYKLLLAMLLVSIVFTGCKKDGVEDEIVKANAVTYDGKTYETPKAFLFKYGIENYEGVDVRSYYIALTSENLTFPDLYRGPYGNGDMIFFELYAPANSTSVIGEYLPHNAIGARQINDMSMYVNYAFTKEEEEMHKEPTWDFTLDPEEFPSANEKGSLKIDKVGDEYEITYTFTFVNGKKIEGYYKGALEIIE